MLSHLLFHNQDQSSPAHCEVITGQHPPAPKGIQAEANLTSQYEPSAQGESGKKGGNEPIQTDWVVDSKG